jgi:hypothetical protein
MNNLAKTTTAFFEEKAIRRQWYRDEWRFSVEDIVAVLAESTDPKQYIKKMRMRDEELKINWGTICTLLEMKAKDGKMRKISSVNTQGAFRIIQSIPSPRAEPFKQRLASLGNQRVEEINDPEL